MKSFSRISLLAASLVALLSTGCNISGSGTIPSSVEGGQDMTFEVDFQYNEDLDTVTGTASFQDCAANINATASFTPEDIEACINAFNEDSTAEDFLNEELNTCLGIDVNGTDIDEGDIALVFGRYELTDECKQRRRCRGYRRGRCRGRGYGYGRSCSRRGRGRCRGRGRGRGCGGVEEEPEVIGAGCLIAVYVDCDGDGCVGDAMAVALIDDSDPSTIFYSNCGILNSGDLTIDLVDGDDDGNQIIFTPISGGGDFTTVEATTVTLASGE